MHADPGALQHQWRVTGEACGDQAEHSEVAEAVDREITELGIEHDNQGNRPGVSLLLGDAVPGDRVDGADGAELGDI